MAFARSPLGPQHLLLRRRRQRSTIGRILRAGPPALRVALAAQTGAALAGAMGVGRFVFTPILPLMEAQAHLTSAAASTLATSNYLGYLVGALLGITVPRLSRTRLALRVSGIVLIATLLAMPLTHDVAAWTAIRGLAGVASAVIFMVAGNTILTELTSAQPHILGWAYGGVGAGIALSGALVAVVKSIGGWQAAWWSSAGIAALLFAAAWSVGEVGRPGRAGKRPAPPAVPAGATAPPVVRHSRRVVLPQRSRLHRRRHVPRRRHFRHWPVVAVEQRLGHRRRCCRPLLRRVDMASAGASRAPRSSPERSSSKRSGSRCLPSPRRSRPRWPRRSCSGLPSSGLPRCHSPPAATCMFPEPSPSSPPGTRSARSSAHWSSSPLCTAATAQRCWSAQAWSWAPPCAPPSCASSSRITAKPTTATATPAT